MIGYFIAGLVAFALMVAGFIGYVMNIVSIFTMSWETITAELLIRLAGIPLPIVGAIAGWF